MASVILFGLVLAAGGVFAGVFFRRDFADALPLSVTGLILLLYLAGFLGALKAGVFLILGLALVLWILSGWRLLKEKSLKSFLKNRFGAGGVYFILLYILLVVLNIGRLAWHSDELSHWMTCVKAMSDIDDFAANYQLSHAAFASYPPGMALFQYFFQKLHEIFDGAVRFCEWRPYTAFQLFCCVLLFPALKRLRFHKFWKPALFAGLMLVPLILYPDFLAAILVDPVLGIMSGAAFIFLLSCRDTPPAEKTAYISMLCALLVLMKDAGVFFAVFIAVSYIPYILTGTKPCAPKWKSVPVSAVPLLSTLAAKGSWKLVLNRFGTPLAFSEPLRIGEYLKIFFAGGDTTFRQETVDLYKAAVVNPGLFKIHEGITTSYLIVLAAAFLVLAVLVFLWIRKTKETKGTVLLTAVLVLQTVLYVFFLGAVYISRFTEYEASILACLDRYIRIGYLPLFLVIVYLSFALLQGLRPGLKYSLSALLCAGIVLLCSFQWLWGFVSRSSVRDSIDSRQANPAFQEKLDSR